jgi:serine/threonine protein kinase
MEHKIFLGKYRVSAQEIEATGELQDTPLAYEGEEIDTGKKIVAEIVPAGSLKPAVREQLAAEAAAAKKLTHVNIPALYDFGIEDDQLVYITENFDGTLAEEWVKTHGPMPVGAALRIASQVVSALGAAALQRISHHAINPTNLVLVPGQTPDGEWPLVKVLHFVGVAPKFSGADGAVAAYDKASPYASPEQLQHGTVDFRSEVYSLGCTMWYLLTAAPPLPAVIGPIAVPSPNVAEKLSGVPKPVRRLLAQMLSSNPDERPSDPLAFYREIQDCLAEVDSRATPARRFGVPVISSTRVPSSPSARRRLPVKALAIAAILLAIATLSALILPGYLKHRRVVRAEEPIGVPIGVPDPTESAPPANTAAVNSTAPNPAPAVAENSNGPAAVTNAEVNNAPLPAANDSAAVASTNQVAPEPVQQTTAPNQDAVQPPPVLTSTTPVPNPPPVLTTNTTNPPVETNAAPPSTNQLEPGPRPRTESSKAEEKVVVTKTPRTPEVRRALPPEPEVRRAEPAPPEEGPADVPANTHVASEQQTNSVTPNTQAQNTEDEAIVTESRPVKKPDAEPKVSAKPRAKKSESATKKKDSDRQVYVSQTAPDPEAGMPKLPRGSVRARFVGVTADGRWMLALPSRKVIVVPPPPDDGR